MRGAEVCRAHRGSSDEAAEASEREELEHAEHAEHADGEARRLAERVAAVVASHPGDVSLSDQLDALRVALARVLADEGDPRDLARDVSRIVEATVRAVRAQQTLEGATAQGIVGALTTILIDLGLGEGP